MIAWLGILMHQAGEKLSPENIDFDPNERTDDVAVKWR